MKEFFAILFLSKIVLLTPQPIFLGTQWREVKLAEPLSAVTRGAVMFVDVTNVPGATRDFRVIDQMFPAGTVEAELFEKGGGSIVLRSSGGAALSKSAIELLVYNTATPVGVEFTRLRVRSNRDLKNVQIRWQNYSK